MNQRAIIVAVVFFVVIVGGMFAYAYMKSAEINKVERVPPAPQKEQSEKIARIDAKHYFSDKTHTVAGEIMMPTPCDLLEAKAAFGKSVPIRNATIDFTVINNTDGACAHVVTPQRFKVSFEAEKDAVITATFEGKSVILNLVEAGSNENPDDFELFQKG